MNPDGSNQHQVSFWNGDSILYYGIRVLNDESGNDGRRPIFGCFVGQTFMVCLWPAGPYHHCSSELRICRMARR